MSRQVTPQSLLSRIQALEDQLARSGLSSQISAYNTISGDNVLGLSGLTSGYALQPPSSLVVVNPIFTQVAGPTSLTQNLVNIAQGCFFITFRVDVTTPWATTATGSGMGNIDVYMRIVVDGAAAQIIKIFHYPATTSAAVPAANFELASGVFSQDHNGSGNTAGDFIVIGFGIVAKNSLVVDLYMTDDFASSGATQDRQLTGSITFSAGYALKVTT